MRLCLWVCLPTKVRLRELVGASRDSCAGGWGKCLTGNGEQNCLTLCGAVGHVQGVGRSAGDTKTQSKRQEIDKNSCVHILKTSVLDIKNINKNVIDKYTHTGIRVHQPEEDH